MTLPTGYDSLFRRYEGPMRTTEIGASAAAAIMRGVPPKDVASIYGISKRTAYRWRKDLVAVEVVRVDGWTATFARRRRKPPVRISAWERVA